VLAEMPKALAAIGKFQQAIDGCQPDAGPGAFFK
jgi:hypothetical protein